MCQSESLTGAVFTHLAFSLSEVGAASELVEELEAELSDVLAVGLFSYIGREAQDAAPRGSGAAARTLDQAGDAARYSTKIPSAKGRSGKAVALFERQSPSLVWDSAPAMICRGAARRGRRVFSDPWADSNEFSDEAG